MKKIIISFIFVLWFFSVFSAPAINSTRNNGQYKIDSIYEDYSGNREERWYTKNGKGHLSII